MQNKVLTLKQAAAFESLLRQAGGLGFVHTSRGDIATGLNTTVLHSLRKAGLITVSRIYLGGHTSPDLKIGATR